MADDKKYYYLKLTDDFFESDEMIILESMTDGYIYSNILLKLYLRSLKNEGKLMFNDRIPFNSEMLSQVTRHNVGNIEKAMKIFQEIGLVEVLDTGAIYMLDIQNFIGKSSTEADRKREYRARISSEKNMGNINLLNTGHLSDKCPDKNPPEIEREKETKKEKEKELEVEARIGQMSTIFKIYEEEIGLITPILSEEIEFYLNEMSPELIIKAISEASTRNIKNWKYIKAILDRCIKENIRTLADFNLRSKKANKEDKREEFNYEDKEVDFGGLLKEYS